MESRLRASQVAQPTVKHLGFRVRDVVALRPKSPLSQPPAEDSPPDRGEAWLLPLAWRPLPASPLQPPPQTVGAEPGSSLLSCASEGFKGFKDCCEAGSFSLGSPQALPQSGRVEVVGAAHTGPAVRALVRAVAGGLRACQPPEPSAEGLGGTYFFADERGGRAAIVKPCDEEPLAPNNPKGFVGRALGEPGLKPSVRVGEAAMREVAAFLLDRGGFAGVPPTVLARVTHSCFHVAAGGEQPARAARDSQDSAPMSCSQASAASLFAADGPPGAAAEAGAAAAPSKLASVQAFVPHRCDASELGTSRFSARDVHRIGILDLRLFNTDRHAGNLLVRAGAAGAGAGGAGAGGWLPQLQLTPIDHGFCLPEALEAPYLEWLHWPQARMPFGEEELAYIASLDAAADVAFLRSELPWLPEGSLRTLQVATLLLQSCAAAGLTLAEVGGVASRPLAGMEEEPSQLEAACLAARARVDALSEEDSGCEDSGCEGSECDGGSDEGALELEEPRSPLAAGACGSSGSPMDNACTASTRSGVSATDGLQFDMEPAASGELLFDLEEDPVAAAAATPPRRVASLRQARGPLRAIAGDVGLARPAPASPGFELRDPAPAAGLARSLATGMLQQRAARRPAGRGFRGVTAGGRPSPKRRLRQAYPPPVVGTHRAGLSSAFDGLDPAGWDEFLQELAALIQHALREGEWRQQADQAGQGRLAMGASCPRF